jgi:catechol 2,3-dioxygenase-like lactoylglutathione lyase family enzyme
MNQPSPGGELYAIELRTSQWEELVRWYRNVMGLRSLLRVVDDGYALLVTGGTRLVIVAHEESGEATPRLTLALEATDLLATIGQLRGAGAEVSEVRHNSEGLAEVITHDPDGNRIRIFSWPGDG